MRRTMLSPKLTASATRVPTPPSPIVIEARNKQELHPEMQANIKAFEKELKCPICFEYVEDAVTPPCHHLFCRKCIVHAIERKSTCPVCSAAIQRGHRSLEAQPWTNDVVNQYRLTLQEVFRDRETDFLFSQVPTGGFAAFKPPVPSPNRTSFIPAANPQLQGIVSIPPPPVQAKSLGVKKQLGVRCRTPAALVAAAAAAGAPPVSAAAPAKISDTRVLISAAVPLGQKREREAEVKQVTFAEAQPARHSTAAASAARAGSLSAAKSDPSDSLSSVSFSCRLAAPAAASPQSSASTGSGLPFRAPPQSLVSSDGAKRTYGKTARPSASAPEFPVALFSTGQNGAASAHESPAKSSAADDASRALNNTPGKDDKSAALAAGAITPNTEPRLSRGRNSARCGSDHNFVKGCDVFACTALSEDERDICEAVLRMGGFHLGADLAPAKGCRNILVTASEADSSSSSGFKVARATSKLWNCLAMGGMVISHTWLFACMAADRLISPGPYTIFNRRDSSFSPLKGWQIFVDLPAPKKAQVESTCKFAGAAVLKRMPTYVETVVPLKAKLKGLEIAMHGQVTGRSSVGHVARITQGQPKQAGADSKVMTFTEEWLQLGLQTGVMLPE